MSLQTKAKVKIGAVDFDHSATRTHAESVQVDLEHRREFAYAHEFFGILFAMLLVSVLILTDKILCGEQ